ncbi:MAG TPA: hypothetical protein ENG69_03385 [Candidatus Korarchaeota archaeon]|nr:hypothetical protein [Candidatus Korarchaeota archaeon]
MSSQKRLEIFERVLDLVESVLRGKVDPFEVNVIQLLRRLREEFPKLKSWDEVNLDLESVLGLARIVVKQEEWVEHRASRLFIDPLLVTLKVETLDPKALATVLLKSWRPIVEARGVTPTFLEAAARYWMELPPFSGRREELPPEQEPSEGAELPWSAEEFEALLEAERTQLLSLLEERGGKLRYEEYVNRGEFWENVKRAYLLSFLATRGEVSLAKNPLTGEIYLVRPGKSAGTPRSMVVSFTKGEGDA